MCAPLGAHCRGGGAARMTSLQKPEPNPDLTSTALAHQGVRGRLTEVLEENKDCHRVCLDIHVVTHSSTVR